MIMSYWIFYLLLLGYNDISIELEILVFTSLERGDPYMFMFTRLYVLRHTPSLWTIARIGSHITSNSRGHHQNNVSE